MASSPLSTSLRTRVPAFAFSVLLQILSVIYFVLGSEAIGAGESIGRQIPYLIGVSLLGSTTLLLHVAPFTRGVVLTIRFLCGFIIGYAMEGRFGTELLIYLSVLVECIVVFPAAFAITTSVIMTMVAALWKQPSSAWGEVISGPRLSDRVLFAAIMFAFTAILLYWRTAVSAIHRTSEQIERLDHAVRRLTKANLSYQDRALSVEIQAAEDERNRISRDIHDSVGYTLTNIIMLTRFAERIAGVDLRQLDDTLAKIGEQAKNGLDDMRVALRKLRSTRVDRVSGNRSIARLIAEYERATDVRVRVYFANASWPPSSPIDDAVFHVVQEGLTNAFRHGQASQVWVQFWRENDELFVTVEDNGRGASDYEIGIGLQGMRERVEKIGGILRAESRSSGFRVNARIPLPAGVIRS